MQTEYISLSVLTLLFLVAWMPASVGKMQSFGMKWLASNRIPLQNKELPQWAARCERAHNNLKDNFPGFVAAILLLGVTNGFSHATAVVSVVYTVARICHFASYGFGNVPLRGLCFFTGLFSNIFLLLKLFL